MSRVLVISASPRRDGNSHILADAAMIGAHESGHRVDHVFLSDHVEKMLENCRECRQIRGGSCQLDDNYDTLLFDHIIPADGIIYAMPLHFYGMPGRLKTMFDRLFCYISKSAPHSDDVVRGLQNKKIGVLISCEESYLGATVGVVTQMQELTRYFNQDLAGVVIGHANSRGEVTEDPSKPTESAARLGSQLFYTRVTDYRVDTVRPNKVW
ncbi:NAD(P)H dehydrogenase [Rhodococcus sp. 06-235-1A]|uniref:flavodoxin family protein n=1 Tax=Rhodococcus sp. 06-235-1A TaxID=2022508 RepID=UPI000B9B551C|nr:flavodoxin family protein [Rhodococcus sp. 06-235-1A]OZD01737.1 NAD(P)H dehydrogenase [Rhodococcus sp. 06-235-1A]